MNNKAKFTIGLPCRNRITFCNESLQLMLKNSDYPIVVIDDASDNTDNTYLQDKRITVIYNKEKKGTAYLWNQVIKSASTEYVIICSDKVRFKKSDFGLIEKKLKEGYGFVATASFHCFALSKFLMTKIGFFDTGFTNCNYEDCDFERRLFINNIAMYFSLETQTAKFQSGWANNDHGENKKYYDGKWIEDNRQHTLTLLHDELNIAERNLYKKMYNNREYLPWEKSVIKIQDLKEYFTYVKFIDRRNDRKLYLQRTLMISLQYQLHTDKIKNYFLKLQRPHY